MAEGEIYWQPLWQVGNSLAQCNRHLLETGILSDVTFQVGFPEGPREMISAHKVFLVARSPVFEAMFCCLLAGKDGDTISVEDTEPSIFKEFLRYLYTDEVLLTKGSALRLLCAAKKYIVTTLETQCLCFLKDNIGADMACTILTHANQFQQRDLEEKCYEYIQLNTKSVFESDDFVNLSHKALCLILGKDELQISNEIDLLKCCIKWAKSQLVKKGREVSDKGVRDTLGAALFLLRLPTTDMTEFATEFGTSQILTETEKSGIFIYGLTKGGAEVAGFPIAVRRIPLRGITRYDRCRYNPGWNRNRDVLRLNDAIGLTVDKPVILEGITIYGTKTASSLPLVTVRICQIAPYRRINITEFANILCPGNPTPIPLHLSSPVNLSAGEYCDIVVSFWDRATYMGEGGQNEITEAGCTFSFSDSAQCTTDTNVRKGQIPGILFRLC